MSTQDSKIKPPRPANWNPFSSKPGLDFAAFLISLAAIGTVELGVGLFVQRPMQAARLTVDFKQLALLYVVWALASVVGFFCVANTFMKRWATIYGWSECSWWMKSVARLFLLSPLLALWATLFTLMFARDGVMLRDGERKITIAVLGAATLFLFHIGFLGWELTQKQVHFAHGDFHLVGSTPARDSLTQVVPRATSDLWLPDEAFHLHVFPYLSPLMKLGLSVYTDFARAKTLSDAIKADPTTICVQTPRYNGQVVPDCFLANYRRIGLKRAFVTPAFGILFESMYREEAMKAHQRAASAMESFALNAVSIDNILTLLEPGPLVFDRRQFTHPLGLLALYGSPELPAISIGQDMQHQLLASKFIPLIVPQIAKIGRSVDEMKASMPPAEEEKAREVLAGLSQRVKALESDPLAMHPPVSIAPSSSAD